MEKAACPNNLSDMQSFSAENEHYAFTNNALRASRAPDYRTLQRVTRQIRRHICRLPLVRALQWPAVHDAACLLG